MLLRPRKFKYKNIFKRRSFRFSKIKTSIKLIYGNSGLLILQPLRLNSKQIYRIKLLVKKGSRKTDISKRKVWFNIFPHLPLSRKVTGSRMGKGTGKLSSWMTELPSGIFLFEYRNLRQGRAFYYFNQIRHRLSTKSRIITKSTFKNSLTLNTSYKITRSSYW